MVTKLAADVDDTPTNIRTIKRSVMQLLQDIETIDHPQKRELYTALLEVAQNENISITKNRRGYWFNLSLLSGAGIQSMLTLIEKYFPSTVKPALVTKTTATASTTTST
jgi:hypothetical protein